MADFLTTDGQSFDTLAAAQAHVLARKNAIDGFHLCFVQEVRQLNGAWVHSESFASPQEHEAKFQAAADDALFCVYGPLSGNNVYCNGKEETLALVNAIVEEYATATGVTKIFRNTHEEGVIWPFVEVQV